MKNLFLIILLFVNFLSEAQNWPKIYGDNISVYSNEVFETYDFGYIIVGNLMEGDILKHGWIIKTDINGEILWQKYLRPDEIFPMSTIFQSDNGDFYIIGATALLDPWWDTYILKLNACGEEQWCKIFHIPHDSEYGVDIKKIPGGNVIALVKYHGTNLHDERIWLFKLTTDGELIWQKLYAQSDPKLFNEDPYEIIVTSDTNFLITGKCYYPQPGQVDPGWIRPYWIKVDSSGNELWELPWGIEEYFYGIAFYSKQDQYNNYYSVGKHIEIADKNEMDHPALFKISNNGEQLYYKDIVSFSEYGQASTLDFLNDSTLVVGASWCMNLDSCYNNCYLLDTLGNVINERTLIIALNCIQGADITHDGKIVMTGGFCLDGNCDIYLWKINSNLEFDTLYNGQYEYDTLCPYPIASDTIDCNCTIVDIEEIVKQAEKELQGWVYPNPATDKFHVSITKVFGIRFQVSPCVIEVFDLFGRKVKEIKVTKGQTEVEVNVEGWKKGLYLVRLISDIGIVGSEKLLVN